MNYSEKNYRNIEEMRGIINYRPYSTSAYKNRDRKIYIQYRISNIYSLKKVE